VPKFVKDAGAEAIGHFENVLHNGTEIMKLWSFAASGSIRQRCGISNALESRKLWNVIGKQSFQITIMEQKFLSRAIYQVRSVKSLEVLGSELCKELSLLFSVEANSPSRVKFYPLLNAVSYEVRSHLSPIVIEEPDKFPESWIIYDLL
jgi:hypothetical protein